MRPKTARRFLTRNAHKRAAHRIFRRYGGIGKQASPSFLSRWAECVRVVVKHENTAIEIREAIS